MAKKELDRFEKNPKHDMQILTKLVGLIAGAVIVSCAGIAAVTLAILDHGIVENTKKGLISTGNGVELTLQDWSKNIHQYADILATGPDVRAVLEASDTSTANNVAREKASKFGVDVLAIVGTNSAILGGYNARSGQNLSSSYAVKKALRGNAASAYEGIGDIEYAVVGATPVYIDGVLDEKLSAFVRNNTIVLDGRPGLRLIIR